MPMTTTTAATIRPIPISSVRPTNWLAVISGQMIAAITAAGMKTKIISPSHRHPNRGLVVLSSLIGADLSLELVFVGCDRAGHGLRPLILGGFVRLLVVA